MTESISAHHIASRILNADRNELVEISKDETFVLELHELEKCLDEYHRQIRIAVQKLDAVTQLHSRQLS